MLSKRVLKMTILKMTVSWMKDVLYINLIDDVQLLNLSAFLDVSLSSILNVISFNSRWSRSLLAVCISYKDDNSASLYFLNYFSSLQFLLSISLIDLVILKTSSSALAQLIQSFRSWQENSWWSLSSEKVSSVMSTCRSCTRMNVNCWNVRTF